MQERNREENWALGFKELWDRVRKHSCPPVSALMTGELDSKAVARG